VKVDPRDKRILAESEVVSITWEREQRDLVILLECLGLPESLRGTWHYVPCKLTFVNCIWAQFHQTRTFAESSEERVRHSVAIVDWGLLPFHWFPVPALPPEVETARASGYICLGFVTEETMAFPWLIAVCTELDLQIVPKP